MLFKKTRKLSRACGTGKPILLLNSPLTSKGIRQNNGANKVSEISATISRDSAEASQSISEITIGKCIPDRFIDTRDWF